MKHVSLFLAAVLLAAFLTGCGASPHHTEGPAPSDQTAPTAPTTAPANAPAGSLSLVVLGDSIARGYGLSDPEQQRFSALLQQKLQAVYAQVSVVNDGVDGLTGSGLADRLAKQPPAGLDSCDAVLISIGGNNVLGPMVKMTVSEADQAALPSLTADYLQYRLLSEDKITPQIKQSLSRMNALISAAADRLRSKEFADMLQAGADDLRRDLPRILSQIRAKNPDCRVFVQTVYNPYRSVSFSLKGIEASLDLSVPGEQAVSALNAAITGLAQANGYTVVDVYADFAAADRAVTFAQAGALGLNFGVDPHPNPAGHERIAELYFPLLTAAS